MMSANRKYQHCICMILKEIEWTGGDNRKSCKNAYQEIVPGNESKGNRLHHADPTIHEVSRLPQMHQLRLFCLTLVNNCLYRLAYLRHSIVDRSYQQWKDFLPRLSAAAHFQLSLSHSIVVFCRSPAKMPCSGCSCQCGFVASAPT